MYDEDDVTQRVPVYVVRTITCNGTAHYRVDYHVRACRELPPRAPVLTKRVASLAAGEEFVRARGGQPLFLAEFHERDEHGFMHYGTPREIPRAITP